MAGGAFVAGTIWQMPAVVLDPLARHLCNDQCHLVNASGTVWSGSGQVEIRDASGHFDLAQNLMWTLQPASLLAGHLVFAVESGHGTPPFLVTIGPRNITAANVDVALSAHVLGLMAPRLAPLGLTGDVRVHADKLMLAHGELTGEAILYWRSAGSMLTTVRPLGEYELRINAGDGTTHASLQTLTGPVQLDGDGSWKQGDAPAFAANAQIPPEQREQLTPLLRLIAIDQGSGRFTLQIR